MGCRPMAAQTTSRRSSTPSSKEVEGYPATHELWTVEVEDESNVWRSYDAGQKNGLIFYVAEDAAREVAKALIGDDPELERGVRMVKWYRLVTTERI